MELYVEPTATYRGSMATPKAPAKRRRGEIETLPSGSLRVRVYGGIDPVTGKRHYLTEIISPGREDAEKTRCCWPPDSCEGR
jgi:integrase